MNNQLLVRPRTPLRGTFGLPQFSNEIPLRIGKETLKHQVLASFALESEKAGIPLPSGEFQSIEQTVSRQWQGYLNATLSQEGKTVIRGDLDIVVTDTRLEVRIGAVPNLQLFRLKPVIDAIEALVPGLGWYVVRTILKSSGHGMATYNMRVVGYEAQGYHHDCATDEEFAIEEYVGEFGKKPKKKDIPALIQKCKEEKMYMPSSVLEEVDGHAYLLGWDTRGKDEKRYIGFTRRRAMDALRVSKFPAELRQCIQSAIDLDDLFIKDKNCSFTWNGFEASTDEYCESDEIEPVGAICYLAWDDTQMLLTAVEHVERCAYENGYAEEILCNAFVELNASTEQLQQLASDLRSYIQRWNAMAKLVACFPETDTED